MKNPYHARRKTDKTNPEVVGPCFVVDEEDTVRAEGICCLRHARVIASALNADAAKKAA